ncbi:MAG: LIC12162 family protein [Legionellaceae bacterium]|nr:LIC12162 family protein [Legionellaceae bacterium]
MISYHLVTSADERTWFSEKPVLFLGKWCQSYNRQNIWKGMDAVLAEPYGFQKGQKKRDLAYVNEVSSQLLFELADELNVFHQTNYSVRFWNIVLGHWMQRCVEVIFNRYATVEQALNKYSIYGTTVIDTTYNLATNDTQSFNTACSDDLWNHFLFSRIIKFLGGVKINFISFKTLGSFQIKQKNLRSSQLRSGVKYLFYLLNNHVFPRFSKKTDAFIASSYLPKWEEIKLALFLGQAPQFWVSPALELVDFQEELRHKINVKTEGYSGFELFLRQNLNELIPICYLEGFKQLMRQVQTLSWPQSPRFIFTSNRYDTDEIFKVWTACHALKGVPYFVGQHGNNFGTSIRSSNFPEMLTCDKFFSWGWSKPSSKFIPAFIFKSSGCNLFKSDPNGGLLLIEYRPPLRLEASDDSYAFSLYQEEQSTFVERLPDSIQQRLTVRLHSYQTSHWAEEKRWRERHPSVSLDLGGKSIKKSIKESRLVVHSYDSTGLLETLASNVPTLCFWADGLEHLLPSARPFYQILRDVSIIVDTAEQAAQFIAMHWDDIEGWWRSEVVQLARESFCSEYARIERRGARKLKTLLSNQLE